MDGLRCVQINLQHNKAATAILARQLKSEKFDIALIQEPYLYKGVIRGLGGTGGTLSFFCPDNNMRTCIYVRNGINTMPLNAFCSRDLTTIKIPGGREGKALIISSAYLPYEAADPITPLLRDLVENSSKANIGLIIGCDANAHHVIWGSSDVNKRGEKLLDFLVSSSLQIINKGNDPTFVNAKRGEVIDITLATNNICRKIMTWHVSNETSLSDHRYICFKYRTNTPVETVLKRNPRNTAWTSFKTDLKVELGDPKGKLNSIIDIELEADNIVRAIQNAWSMNCPEKKTAAKKVPWWNPDLAKLRKETRAIFNDAKASKNFETYAKKLTEYNKAVRKAKRKAWRDHCDQIGSIPEGMRLTKALATTRSVPLTTIRSKDGIMTETGLETLKIMCETHFPGSIIHQSVTEGDSISAAEQVVTTTRHNWDTAKKVVDHDRIKWALTTFRPYKAPGPDGVYPILLQEGANVLIPHLSRLYRACLAFGHVPHGWRQVKVIYLPKPGKADYNDARSYRPISLSSFFLKTMEKMVDRYIRDGPLKRHPLHKMQCAYQPGKSTDSAIHLVVSKAEQAIENKEICLAAFLDVEGAFDRTTYHAIKAAADRHGIEPTICRWMDIMLNSRLIKSTLLGEELLATATKGCPQGGVLSPTLWSLVIDSLLEELNTGPVQTVGYADDLVILVNGKFPSIVAGIMNEALIKVEKWCNMYQLSINPSKTVVIPFTRKRDLKNMQSVKMYDKELQLSNEVKYLGIILDKQLNWKKQSEYTMAKATRVFGMCRSAYGKTWGLNPKVLKWIYTMMVKPIILYGCLAWWPRTLLSTCRNSLSKIQRIACMAITGAFRTTPTAAIEVLLDLPPLHIAIQTEARKSLNRMKMNGLWNDSAPRTKHTKMEQNKHIEGITAMSCDKMQPRYIFRRHFKVYVPSRAEWAEGLKTPEGSGNTWYTDGSKMKSGTGAGIYAKDFNTSVSMGNYATVFQAETYAIIACAQENIDRKVKETTIYILSDSQAALKALTSPKVDSRLIHNGVQALNKLGRHNKVRLIWIPGHKGFTGNEKADELARKGSTNKYIGPEPYVGLSQGTIKTAINDHTKLKHQQEWKAVIGLRHSKRFIENVNTSWTKKLWSLSRKQLQQIVGVFTGHFGTKYILAKMGLQDNVDCRICGEEVESMEHILCECDALARTRMRLFGDGYPVPGDFKALPLRLITRFMDEVIEAME